MLGQIKPPLGGFPAGALQQAGLLFLAHKFQGSFSLGNGILPRQQLWQQGRMPLTSSSLYRFSHPSQKDIANICNPPWPHGDLQWMAEKSPCSMGNQLLWGMLHCQFFWPKGWSSMIQLASSRVGWTTRIDLKPSEQTP